MGSLTQANALPSSTMAERLPLRQRMAGQDLVRPTRGRLIAGVCVGVAQRFDVSPTLVRVLFLLSLLLPGPQVLAYIALWILMPSEADDAAPGPAHLGGASETASDSPPSQRPS